MINYELNSKDKNFNERLNTLFQGIILSKYPIVQNRNRSMVQRRERLEISIDFIEDKEKYTDIIIGNYIQIVVLGLIDLETLCQLLDFLLKDHGIVKEFNKNGPYIYLNSVIDYENSLNGMLCDEINVTISFAKYRERGNIMPVCEEMIFDSFNKNISWTLYYREKQREKISSIIESLTEEEIIVFKHIFSLMTYHDIKRILRNMSIEDFYETYQTYIKKLEKKEGN